MPHTKINVIVMFQILLCAENWTNMFNLFVSRRRVKFSYQVIRRLTKRALRIKCCRYPVRKTSAWEKPHCSTLEVYKDTPISIPVYIMEDVVESVIRKLLGITGPRGTDSETLQGWLLKLGDYRKIICFSVENFVEWMANKSPPSVAYWSFMSGHLIALDKKNRHTSGRHRGNLAPTFF